MQNGVSAIPGFIVGKRLVVDYHAHVDVRQLGNREIIGSVETVASGAPNEPEVGPDGEKHAVMEAIDEALEKAIATFAPRLVASAPGGDNRRGPAGGRRQRDPPADRARRPLPRALAG